MMRGVFEKELNKNFCWQGRKKTKLGGGGDYFLSGPKFLQESGIETLIIPSNLHPGSRFSAYSLTLLAHFVFTTLNPFETLLHSKR